MLKTTLHSLFYWILSSPSGNTGSCWTLHSLFYWTLALPPGSTGRFWRQHCILCSTEFSPYWIPSLLSDNTGRCWRQPCLLCSAEFSPHLQITLVGVEDNAAFLVELSHHLHGQTTDGRLKVRLFCIHHDAYFLLWCVLKKIEGKPVCNTQGNPWSKTHTLLKASFRITFFKGCISVSVCVWVHA